MKLAVITDATAVLTDSVKSMENLHILQIPVIIDGVTYIPGDNLSLEDFYDKMANSSQLPTTSQANLAALEELLTHLASEHYTHVVGLFMSSGISGFWQNIQYLKDDYPEMTIVFPDTKITSAQLGAMVENVLNWSQAGMDFDQQMTLLQQQIDKTAAFIMVDDLNHLVKGGRLSNGSALIGNLLSIKPILHFDKDGSIVVYEKVRTEKKAIKRLVKLLQEVTAEGNFQVFIIHSQVQEKADAFYQLLKESGYEGPISIVPFDAVIATHLGEKAIAFGYTPIFN